MAMITCPECGGSISDKARFCVHCGCKLVVCPECGASYVGSATACKECGYIFEKQTPPVQPVQPAQPVQPVSTEKKQKFQDLYQVWEEQKGKTGLETASKVFFWIRMGLVGLMILAIIFWGSSLMTLLAVRFLLLTAALCTAIRVILEIIDTIRPPEANTFLNWCQAKGMDVKALVKKSLEIDKKKLTVADYRQELVDIEFILNKCSASNSKAVRVKEIVEGIWGALFGSACSWCFVKFFTRNISIYVVTDTFKFSMLEGWRLFIVPGVVLAIGMIWFMIGDTIDKKAREKWMKTNLPETEELYNKVMKDLKQYEVAVEENDEDKVEIVR